MPAKHPTPLQNAAVTPPPAPCLDRSQINRALAKAIAYKQCGQHTQANAWAAELVALLGCIGILTDEACLATQYSRDCD